MPAKSDLKDLIRRVRRGDHAAAARALSLVVDEDESAASLARDFFKSAGSAQKVGVCGPPGAGKSTLTGRLIGLYRARKIPVGVLAVDPSSSLSGGAFLGDRLRIMAHATDPGVFIRSLASRGMVGGLTHAIFGAVHVLEALGCAKIIVETVGTGQDEVEIASVADTVLYVTTPALGDEIQAMKAGAMEIGDVFVVNKADLAGRDKAVADLRGALGLGRAAGQAPRAWEPPVVAVSALSGEGVEALGRELDAHWAHLERSGERRERLKRQHRAELEFWIQRRVLKTALGRVDEKALKDLLSGKTDPASLGAKLLRKH
ncbi:MAG: methylmalonyl Co-A mutase-associated GTPase MeaB [Elusimicrobia bacterium]|nr:methylmalonyl Co-A mutase-associated GTPase MeaB [Elusimicrobiota bacterium]